MKMFQYGRTVYLYLTLKMQFINSKLKPVTQFGMKYIEIQHDFEIFPKIFYVRVLKVYDS